jgi:hypothetical protein
MDSTLQIGDRSKVSDEIVADSVLQGARAAIKKLLEDVVDREENTPLIINPCIT